MHKGTGFDYYLNWTRTLIAEMNAAISCLHSNAEGLKAAEREQAERIVAGLREMRDDFGQTVGLQRVTGAAAWTDVRSESKSKWTAFETELAKNVKTLGEKAEQHLQAILQQQAVAQRKAWRDFVGQLNAMAEVLAAKHHAEFRDLLKDLNADAEAARRKLKQLCEAGSQSVCAFRSALNDTRTAFGKAAETAQQAFCEATTLSPAE